MVIGYRILVAGTIASAMFLATCTTSEQHTMLHLNILIPFPSQKGYRMFRFMETFQGKLSRFP